MRTGNMRTGKRGTWNWRTREMEQENKGPEKRK